MDRLLIDTRGVPQGTKDNIHQYIYVDIKTRDSTREYDVEAFRVAYSYVIRGAFGSWSQLSILGRCESGEKIDDPTKLHPLMSTCERSQVRGVSRE